MQTMSGLWSGTCSTAVGARDAAVGVYGSACMAREGHRMRTLLSQQQRTPVENRDLLYHGLSALRGFLPSGTAQSELTRQIEALRSLQKPSVADIDRAIQRTKEFVQTHWPPQSTFGLDGGQFVGQFLEFVLQGGKFDHLRDTTQQRIDELRQETDRDYQSFQPGCTSTNYERDATTLLATSLKPSVDKYTAFCVVTCVVEYCGLKRKKENMYDNPKLFSDLYRRCQGEEDPNKAFIREMRQFVEEKYTVNPFTWVLRAIVFLFLPVILRVSTKATAAALDDMGNDLRKAIVDFGAARKGETPEQQVLRHLDLLQRTFQSIENGVQLSGKGDRSELPQDTTLLDYVSSIASMQPGKRIKLSDLCHIWESYVVEYIKCYPEPTGETRYYSPNPRLNKVIGAVHKVGEVVIFSPARKIGNAVSKAILKRAIRYSKVTQLIHNSTMKGLYPDGTTMSPEGTACLSYSLDCLLTSLRSPAPPVVHGDAAALPSPRAAGPPSIADDARSDDLRTCHDDDADAPPPPLYETTTHLWEKEQPNEKAKALLSVVLRATNAYSGRCDPSAAPKTMTETLPADAKDALEVVTHNKATLMPLVTPFIIDWWEKLKDNSELRSYCFYLLVKCLVDIMLGKPEQAVRLYDGGDQERKTLDRKVSALVTYSQCEIAQKLLQYNPQKTLTDMVDECLYPFKKERFVTPKEGASPVLQAQQANNYAIQLQEFTHKLQALRGNLSEQFPNHSVELDALNRKLTTCLEHTTSAMSCTRQAIECFIWKMSGTQLQRQHDTLLRACTAGKALFSGNLDEPCARTIKNCKRAIDTWQEQTQGLMPKTVQAPSCKAVDDALRQFHTALYQGEKDYMTLMHLQRHAGVIRQEIDTLQSLRDTIRGDPSRAAHCLKQRHSYLFSKLREVQALILPDVEVPLSTLQDSEHDIEKWQGLLEGLAEQLETSRDSYRQESFTPKQRRIDDALGVLQEAVEAARQEPPEVGTEELNENFKKLRAQVTALKKDMPELQDPKWQNYAIAAAVVNPGMHSTTTDCAKRVTDLLTSKVAGQALVTQLAAAGLRNRGFEL